MSCMIPQTTPDNSITRPSYKDETSPLPVVSPAPVATVHPSRRRRDITGEINGCENVKRDEAARAVARSMWNDHTGQRRSGKRSDATLIEWPSISDVNSSCMAIILGRKLGRDMTHFPPCPSHPPAWPTHATISEAWPH